MKEIIRHVMKTSWVQNKLKEPWIRKALEEWTIDSLRRSLKPEGKPRFDEFINSLQKGETFFLTFDPINNKQIKMIEEKAASRDCAQISRDTTKTIKN